MVGVAEVVQTWERVIADWRAGVDQLPDPLDRWREESYRGRGAGAIDAAAIPEPYLGSWADARSAVLALNPGRAHAHYQHRRGVFDLEIGQLGSYAAWAATWAFVRPPWTDALPAVRHTTSRLEFLRRWYDDEVMPISSMLAVELYPWHSARVTAVMRPDPGIVREFIWHPIIESGIGDVFAFGAPWFPLLEDRLQLEVIDRLGAGGRPYGSRVASRAVLVCAAANGLRVIAEKHSGSAGPPSEDETLRLREAIGGA